MATVLFTILFAVSIVVPALVGGTVFFLRVKEEIVDKL